MSNTPKTAAPPAAAAPAAAPTDPKAGAAPSDTTKAVVAGCSASCPRCHAPITTDQLTTIFPSAPSDRIADTKDAFNKAFEKFELIRCLRKAHFFAQIRQEAGASLTVQAESMNYNKAGLLGTFGSAVKAQPDAVDYARTATQPADQEAIADRVYANRLGNGDVASGDGWRYRGRGYIQVTGKTNYENVQKEIDKRDPGSGINIVNNETDIGTPEGALISAMAYWTLNGLNKKADGGDADAVVNSITAVINLHTKSYAERVQHYKVTMKVFQTPQCLDRNKPSSEAKPYVQTDGPDAAPAAAPATASATA